MLETHWSLHDCTISDRYLEVNLSLRSEHLFLHLSLYFCFPPPPDCLHCASPLHVAGLGGGAEVGPPRKKSKA